MVIHYTGSMNVAGTLVWFQNKTSQVSAHYVIGLDGATWTFEDLETVLWHAGKSSWNGRDWCNNFSVGIELVGDYNSGFTNDQYDAVISLLKAEIFPRCDISAIVGHEQVAPGRKIDPGPRFDWNRIIEGIVGLEPGLKQVGPQAYNVHTRPTFGPGTMASGRGTTAWDRLRERLA